MNLVKKSGHFRGLGKESGLSCLDGKLHGRRILNTPAGVKDFQGNDITGSVVIEDHAWLDFVRFFDLGVAENDGEHINLAVVVCFHGFPQYFSILLVRYTVTMTGG